MKSILLTSVALICLAAPALAQVSAGDSTSGLAGGPAAATTPVPYGGAGTGWSVATPGGTNVERAWVDGGLPDGAQEGLVASSPEGADPAAQGFEPWQ